MQIQINRFYVINRNTNALTRQTFVINLIQRIYTNLHNAISHEIVAGNLLDRFPRRFNSFGVSIGLIAAKTKKQMPSGSEFYCANPTNKNAIARFQGQTARVKPRGFAPSGIL